MLKAAVCEGQDPELGNADHHGEKHRGCQGEFYRAGTTLVAFDVLEHFHWMRTAASAQSGNVPSVPGLTTVPKLGLNEESTRIWR